MNPSRPVPQPQADALKHAAEARRDARTAWEQAVNDAIATGASLREIAKLAGVSHGTIETIAKRSIR